MKKLKILLLFMTLISSSTYSKTKHVALEIPQSVIDNCKTVISNYSFNNDIKISPNPSTGKFLIQFSDSKKINKPDIKIQNMIGQTIILSTSEIRISEKIIVVDLSNYTSGLYLISITNENIHYNSKIILK